MKVIIWLLFNDAYFFSLCMVTFKAQAISISDSFFLTGTHWFLAGTHDFSQDESQSSLLPFETKSPDRA